MATPRKPEFSASIAVKIWVDVPFKAVDLDAALAHAKEIKLDEVLKSANENGVIDVSDLKITGVYSTEDWQS